MPDMREEFEAWVRTQVPEPSLATVLAYSAGNDLYLNPHIQGRYEGWKASRAALRVELPDDGIEDCRRDWQNSCRDNFDTGYCYATDRITQALQQAGIEVK
ncbi:TPA: hypothetical protein SMW55_005063 [Pseudomonas aeruginosa]|nr:hypothetical protein [Pseudomonas aeruginosa]